MAGFLPAPPAPRDELGQEPEEFFGAGIVLLVAAQRYHDVALEFGVGDFQEPDPAAVYAAPRKFGPEPDSDAARDGVFHGERVVALENDARLEPDAFAVLVADAAQLLASVKPDEVRLLQFLETDGVALFV